ncbi:MAG TPA: peptidoglycan DD-metalloendopeptidase family protein [Nocardioides sp.]
MFLPSLAAGTLLLTALAVAPAVAGEHERKYPQEHLLRDARAGASPQTAFQMPFPCGQAWTGTTRSTHSPSSWAIDWNRTDDAGDPVVAAAPGTVVRAEPKGTSGYGHYVMVEHADDERTIYAHLDQLTVSVGQTVDQAAQLGTVGNTGNSFGSHLHFEERRGNTVLPPYFAGTAFTFGSTLVSQNCVDVPLAGDFADGPEAEVVVFRRTQRGRFVVQRVGQAPLEIGFGNGTDQPFLGDWDGDGKANPGVRVPAYSRFRLKTPAGVTRFALGRPRDLPIAGDWDGDGRWEVGLRKAATGRFVQRAADGTRSRVALGDLDDLPVTGDWDGDGRTDLGVYDQATATFTLRIVDADGLAWTAQVPFGVPGDLPVTGDWDGNGRTDVGVWNPTTATFSQRRAAKPTAARATETRLVFGNPR